MATWSFVLGFVSLIALLVSPALQMWPVVMPFVLLGGLALAAAAVILGMVGLFSINRLSAIAGMLLGLLALATYYLFLLPLVGVGM